MLPPKLLFVSMLVFLLTAVSTAPVEEKEQEELEAAEEGEGELSEEEEDDDDSKSHDRIEGAVGVQQTTAVAAVPVAAGGSGVSSIIQDVSGSDGVDSESNVNGQKLLNGGGGGAGSQTGVSSLFGGGASPLDYTGTIDPASHDFLLSLMGGGDPFRPGVHINIPGDVTPPTQLDFTVMASGVTAAPSGSSLDSPSDSAHHSDISIDQSASDHAPLSSGPDQSLSSTHSVSGSSHSDAVSSYSSHSEAHRAQTDGNDSSDFNGNGRQTLLTDSNTADHTSTGVTMMSAGGVEPVTGFHIDLTASGIGHDVTESSPVVLHTETDSYTVSGGYSHTDGVTMATDSTGPVSADPTGTPPDSSHPAVTDNTHTAGSVTEQYNPSGQGPEGAENVELEDTC
ncbi:uncharacterized protein si:ch211-80h18.1 [Centropristis striata]|uniref:uncharacterized protein si:ch211-80h18.1 n=1 Tax=Centropristis striata TaxID=184440 RepID=UPI0027E0267B|nr:uncharacterized protein si:ch211-80h18.1 [Centropristis striata]